MRLAKPADAVALAELHFNLLGDLPGGILKTLGRAFRHKYYRTMLAETESLVLCLESREGHIVGLATGSLDAAEHTAQLKRHRIRLAWAALPAMVLKPTLIRSMLNKQNASDQGDSDNGYVVNRGPRLEFWGVTEAGRAGGGSLSLLQTWLSIAKLLGAGVVRFEVNDSEADVARIHCRLGAKEEKEFVTPEGLRRRILKYEL
jgi:hypothetical protein